MIIINSMYQSDMNFRNFVEKFSHSLSNIVNIDDIYFIYDNVFNNDNKRILSINDRKVGFSFTSIYYALYRMFIEDDDVRIIYENKKTRDYFFDFTVKTLTNVDDSFGISTYNNVITIFKEGIDVKLTLAVEGNHEMERTDILIFDSYRSKVYCPYDFNGKVIVGINIDNIFYDLINFNFDHIGRITNNNTFGFLVYDRYYNDEDISFIIVKERKKKERISNIIKELKKIDTNDSLLQTDIDMLIGFLKYYNK